MLKAEALSTVQSQVLLSPLLVLWKSASGPYPVSPLPGCPLLQVGSPAPASAAGLWATLAPAPLGCCHVSEAKAQALVGSKVNPICLLVCVFWGLEVIGDLCYDCESKAPTCAI